ncbi:AEC family transporter [Moraxella sp. FZLJ2107]|uniref:AEC family transporter n=1 Tax=unclassified Moraxella TaxID=2685852 RepID=UPI0020C8B61B|nr:MULTISPECIES: AEC family transporter [unclassified Moraxella]UTO05315.1 AEC family transporter [Moraxella sp. FZLJ2107]UTO22050.1 AEC family transporter [Moraxella sp. FZLJ2109]
MLAAIIFAISITLPNLLLMLLGFMMKKQGKVNEGFIQVATNMVFNYCLPCLLFFSVLKSNVDIAKQVNLLTAGLACTLTLFILAEIYAKFFVEKIEDKGVFVQGVFRSNMAIMSLAVVANAYGADGLSVGAVYMGILTIVYNILAVITLSRTAKTEGGIMAQATGIIGHIIKNPLVIALVAAFAYKAVGLPALPSFIIKTGELLGAVALPLALICAGATLNLKSMLSLSGVSMQASIGRIIIAPVVAVLFGLGFGLQGVEMGVLFLMIASPAAAASYVMAKAMGGNDVLAANILGFTTVFAMIGMAAGMAALRVLGLA